MANLTINSQESYPTSIRLSLDSITRRNRLSAKLHINRTAVIELALKEFAEKHGVIIEDTKETKTG